MQTYAEVLTYAIPGFFVLILIELFFSYRMNRKVIRSFDTVSSLSSGLTNSIKEVLGLAVVIISYSYMVNHIAIFRIESEKWIYLLAFIGIDFAGYWIHRFEHQINILWNRHIIHHSSEEFNLACALRQNISAVFGVFFFLYLPLAIFGIPAEVIAIVAPLHLFAQFWYHTRLIDKMGILERIIVTPSHHRVHHAINDIYLDKNFSQVLIIWDKFFGTFQEELAEEIAVYGVKRQVNTWNPILINFQHLWLLIKDAWYTRSWIDKIRVFIMPTGWRPKDREHNDPISYIGDPSTQIKYSTEGSNVLHIWSWLQLIIHVFLMIVMFQSLADYRFDFILLYGAFLMLSIFAYTSVMDRSVIALPAELLKIILGAIALYLVGDWYVLGQWTDFSTAIILGYMLVSLLMTIYWTAHRELDSIFVIAK